MADKRRLRLPWELPTSPRDAGGDSGVGRVPFDRLPLWLRTALGTKGGDVPSNLELAGIVGTVDALRPVYAFRKLPDGTANGTTGIFIPDGFGLALEIISIGFQYNASAVVADRIVRADFNFSDAITNPPYYSAGSAFVQVASTNVRYSVAPVGGGAAGAGNTGSATLELVLIPIPIGFAVIGPSIITLAAENADAGDTITNPVLYARQVQI